MQNNPYPSQSFDTPYGPQYPVQPFYSSKPKADKKVQKVRAVVDSSQTVNNTEFKKMLGILIILLIVVFFTVFINIVITLMKPGCKCGNMFPMQAPMPPMQMPQYWAPPI